MKFAGLFTSTILGTATVVVSMTAFSSEAYAWVQVCNKTTDLVTVAYGRGFDHGITSKWISKGWWNLQPDGCAIVDSGSAGSSGSYGPYFYANSSRKVWTGSTSFCGKNSIFEYTTWNGPGPGCPSGFFSLGFRKINSGTNTNFTINLT